MASTNERNEQKQSKLELSQPQLNSLVSATGMTEEKIREIAGEYVHFCINIVQEYSS